MLKIGGWCWYLSGQEDKLEKHKCGKWMYFFYVQEFAQKICEATIEACACYECKCTDMKMQMTDTGVICFYLNGDDIENHYRVIDFMIQNNLIRKTKSRRYYNNSFKFDNQTKAGEYGADFQDTIVSFINVETTKVRGNLLDVLKHVIGLSNQKLELMYTKPVTTFNFEMTRKYGHYS